jgi:hypothetical protein
MRILDQLMNPEPSKASSEVRTKSKAGGKRNTINNVTNRLGG